ncbi:MAG: hypothetical protein JO273_10270 [Methylobacteriaceae bacterium]|nr:hypothetical protein [Methylobacteriaceae bacterium]
MVSMFHGSNFVAVAMLTAAGLLPAHAGPKNRFDGNWSVEVITRHGKCDMYKWRIVVGGGKITDLQGNLAQATGGISARGRVAVVLTRGSDSLSATGSLSTQSGSGSWVSKSKGCSGEWRAERL